MDIELDQSITRGDLARVIQLVEQGANVNRGGLHKACMFGQIEIVKFLLSKCAKFELKLANGETCLHTCMSKFSITHSNEQAKVHFMDKKKFWNIY